MERRATPATSFAVGIWTTQGLVLALLVARRASGAYHGPLPSPALLVAIAIFAVGAVGAAALCWNSAEARRRSGLLAAALTLLFAWMAAAGPTTAQIGALLAVTLGTIVVGCVLSLDLSDWLIGLQEPALPSCARRTDSAETTARPAVDAPVPVFDRDATCSEVRTAEPDASIAIDQAAATDENDPRTTHAMVRRHEDDRDVIEGTVRVSFPVGLRDATIHLAFAPPFAFTPAIEFEPVEGDDWEIKVEAVFPYGVRVRVRRDRLERDACDRRLAYHASAPWSQRQAA